MGKYEPLTEFLREYQGDACQTSFAELENELGFSLPASARKHRAWWANQFKGHHSQAKAWIEAGWEVDPKEIDLAGETVRFVRTRRNRKKVETSELSNLREKAMRFSGISDLADLEEAALKLLIQHHAARALIELGGQDPAAKAPSRRRAL